MASKFIQNFNREVNALKKTLVGSEKVTKQQLQAVVGSLGASMSKALEKLEKQIA